MQVAAALEVRPPSASSPGADARSAARTLAAVGALGAVVALLTWRVAGAGLGWMLADAVLVGAVLGGIGRGRPRLPEVLLGGASVWLASATVWYASDWALATALPASAVTLAALGLVRARAIGAASVDRVGVASLDALRALPGSIADAARTPVHALNAAARGHFLGALRGALLGLPIAGAFALLLSADARFRHAVGRMVERSGEGLELAVWIGGSIAALLVAHAVLARVSGRRDAEPEPLAWFVRPYRAEGDAELAVLGRTGPRVRPITWGVVLLQIAAVFAVYVGANAATLFAGHDHVRARGTVTYAEYLHEGFTQVSVATLLAVACVVLGHALLRPREGGAQVLGGRAVAAAELTLLGLVGVTLASCAHRLALYEEAYGYTYLRLGVWVLQLGVAGLLLMTAARCVARSRGGWGTALVWSGVAFAVLVGSIDADGWIAGRNVARARAGASLDVGYLGELSEDASGVLPELAALDPDAARYAADAWGASRAAHRDHGWRAWRGIGR